MEQYRLVSNENIIVTYYEAGNRNNPLIVCLHGLAGNAIYTFAEISLLLKKDFHLILLDLPGHGSTSPLKEEGDYLFSSLARWLQKAIRQITRKPFYIMGHSWGADIALHYAKYFPNEPLGVILLDGGFTFPGNQREMTFNVAVEGWEAYMDQSKLVKWDDIINEYKTYTKRWDMQKEAYVRLLFQEENNLFSLIPSKFTVLSIIKSFFKEPFIEAYPYITVPVLLIHATIPKSLDESRLLGIAQLKTAISDITIVPMKNAGHMIGWDDPERTSFDIKSWILRE